MGRFFGLLAVMLVLASCSTLPARDSACTNPVSTQDFFGKRAFVFADLFAKVFAVAHEPSLDCRSSNSAHWRFSYDRYGKPSVTIHAEKDRKTYGIRVIMYRMWLTENDGWKSKVVRDFRRRLSSEEWQQIEAAAVAADFWRQPLERHYEGDLVIFGRQIELIEGRAEDYRVIDPDLHSSLDPLRDVLRRLARLADD